MNFITVVNYNTGRKVTVNTSQISCIYEQEDDACVIWPVNTAIGMIPCDSESLMIPRSKRMLRVFISPL